jgi:hypothetical protein
MYISGFECGETADFRPEDQPAASSKTKYQHALPVHCKRPDLGEIVAKRNSTSLLREKRNSRNDRQKKIT